MASSGANRLDGKVALVTGGSRGIGRAIAAAYARAGARVYICGRNQDDVGTAVRELQASGGAVDGETADVGSVEDVKRVVRSATRRFGTIDVLVNNASILRTAGDDRRVSGPGVGRSAEDQSLGSFLFMPGGFAAHVGKAVRLDYQRNFRRRS